MANNEIPLASDPVLLTIKGQITLHFMDGKTLTGEFATQDSLNIFLVINGEPLMIPRSQIRYIKGTGTQQIQPDDSQGQFRAKKEAEETVEIASQAIAASIHDDQFEDDDDVTMLLTEDDEDDATVFLTSDEDEDMTVFIDEDDEENQATLVVGGESQQPVITAYLDCTTGPHTGEKFELQSGVTTIGRSTDNIFSLPGDKEASRRHAQIIYKDDKFIIEDRGSLNGVMVNDNRIDGPRQLEHGDSILIGVSTLVFYEK